MTGDSQSRRELGRGRALGAAPVLALALCGCAVSFERDDGRRDVVGFFSVEHEAAALSAASGTVRRFAFYGVWLDDAFRGTSLTVGEVQLTVADLRNQWHGAEGAPPAATDEGDCTAGFALQWCSLPAADPQRAGELFEIAVAGVTAGVGAEGRHFGIGYHRQTLIEVTNSNALVAWPAGGTVSAGMPAVFGGTSEQAGVQSLLRGSFNG